MISFFFFFFFYLQVSIFSFSSIQCSLWKTLFSLFFQNILDKFNPGARQLINAGKAYLKALHGEWIKWSVQERLGRRDRNGRVWLERVERRPVYKERGELGGKGGGGKNFVLAPWVLLQDRIASSLALWAFTPPFPVLFFFHSVALINLFYTGI